jgi:hypothetical protein
MQPPPPKLRRTCRFPRNLSGGDRIELIERPSPNITGSAPVTAQQGTGVHVFTPGITRLSTTWTYERRKPSGHLTSGEVLLNTNLYNDGVLYRFDPRQGAQHLQGPGVLPPHHRDHRTAVRRVSR